MRVPVVQMWGWVAKGCSLPLAARGGQAQAAATPGLQTEENAKRNGKHFASPGKLDWAEMGG